MSTTPTHTRPAVVALVVVAALGCLALGWWQFSRWESSTGSFQNLGYALQWPLFAAFVVYAYRRVAHLEAEPDDDAPPAAPGPAPVTELAEGVLPARTPNPVAQAQDDDPVLADYNAYLASLEQARRTAP